MPLSSNCDKIVGRCVSHHELVISGVTAFLLLAIDLKEILNLAFHLSNYHLKHEIPQFSSELFH